MHKYIKLKFFVFIMLVVSVLCRNINMAKANVVLPEQSFVESWGVLKVYFAVCL